MRINNLQAGYNQTVYNPKKQTFKGLGTIIGNTNKIAMQFLEKGGFFAEFCLMDMCGLVIPRVYQGFQRNKEELGHLNYQAGMEEFLREAITGPSMFLIPITAVILAGKRLGKATQVSFGLLSKFSEIFKGLGEKFAGKSVDKTQEAFAHRVFNNFFVNNPDRLATTGNSIEKFRKQFVSTLTAGLSGNLTKDKAKANMGKFIDTVANINAAHFKNENSTLLKIVENGKDVLRTTASDLYLDARKYMEDIIPSAKLSFDEIKQVPKKVFEETIDKLTRLRKNGRELLCVGGTAALAAFLCIIPKIYQLSKKNPALNGLVENNDKNNIQGGKKC